MAETTFTFKDASGNSKTALAAQNGSGQIAPSAVLYAIDGTQLIGPKTKAASLPVVFPTDLDPVPVIGQGTTVVPTITVSTTPAYSVGDAVGGLITLSNAVRASGLRAFIRSLFILDTSNVKNAFELLFFNANPSSSTITDNAAFVLHSSDTAKLIQRVSVAASDYVTLDTKGMARVWVGDEPVTPTTGRDLYMAIVIPASGGTPTYAATTALTFRVKMIWE